MLSRENADLWYGFHVLLLPFTLIGDQLLGLKLAGVFLLTLFLFLIYRTCVLLNLRAPWLWPFLLFFVAPIVMFRWLAVRPHMVTMPLSALLLALICRRKTVQSGICAWALVFTHITFCWMVPAVTACALVAQAVVERKPAWKAAAATLAGAVVGVLVRPNPAGALRMFKVHLFDLAAVKQLGLPLTFGAEVNRVENTQLVEHFLPFMVLWLGAVVWVLLRSLRKPVSISPPHRVVAWSCLLLSVGFFQLSVASSSRGVDPWVVFGTLLIGSVFTSMRDCHTADEASAADKKPKLAFRLAWAAPAVLLGYMAWSGTVRTARAAEEIGIDGNRLRPAMEAVGKHSKPGDIVFHVNWSLFAEMFFWNRHNRYINGMDPIFLYSFDRGLYWKVHRLENSISVETTSGSPPHVPPVREDTYTVLRRDFQASYLLIWKQGTPGLYEWVSHDPRFESIFDSDTTAVFALLPNHPSGQ